MHDHSVFCHGVCVLPDLVSSAKDFHIYTGGLLAVGDAILGSLFVRVRVAVPLQQVLPHDEQMGFVLVVLES